MKFDAIRLVVCSSLALAILPVAAVSPAASDEAVMVPNVFEENLDTRVKVAGDVRKGVLATDPSRTIDLENLVVWIPDLEPAELAQTSALCVDIHSIDGVYTASLSFPTPTSEGPVRLQITDTSEGRTKHSKELNAYRAYELGVLAYLVSNSTSCPGKVISYLAAGWGTDQGPPNELYLQVNSHKMTTSISERETGEVFPCERIQGTDRRKNAFDRSCSVPSSANLSALEIHRTKFRTNATPIQMPISLP